MTSGNWPNVAVMGAGAVGCYFGGMLARAGAPVTLIGRSLPVEALEKDGLWIDSFRFQQRIRVRAARDASAARDAEIVLFCVKTTDNEAAARALAPHLAAGAIVASLQNGVDNVERIRAASGIEALPSVVYVAVDMPEPGRVRHSGRGDLVMGELREAAREAPGRKNEIERVAELFVRADVPCRIAENMEGELWTKLVMNCAYNAVSALGHAKYGRLVRHDLAREVMRQVVEEALCVARAANVQLPSADYFAAARKLGEAMELATSSTAQDIARGRRTEIDSLNGYLVRRGRELGVSTPVNFTLYALVKVLEEATG